MKFIKDILLFSLETTGVDPEKDNIIQLSAVLLDKDNLLEKNFYNSYVRVSLLDGTIKQHAELLDVDFETMRRSPKIYDAVKKFQQHFGDQAMLATHNLTNLLFLRNAFRKAPLPFDYDRHIIELWTLGYVYTLHYGIKKMPTFNTFLDYFHIKLKHRHNSLEKARASAEIFRQIIKST
jgi:DNA polymerase III subunit alpha, Gram-positive type